MPRGRAPGQPGRAVPAAPAKWLRAGRRGRAHRPRRTAPGGVPARCRSCSRLSISSAYQRPSHPGGTVSSPPSLSAAPARGAVAAGTTAADALAAAGVPLTGPSGAVVVRDLASGALKDLDWAPEADAEVEPVALESGDGRNVLRHSTAHVMAQAVQDLF